MLNKPVHVMVSLAWFRLPYWYGLFIVVPDNDIRYYSLKRIVTRSPLKTMMMWSANEVLKH